MTTIEKASRALAVQWFCETGHDNAEAVAAAESQWKGFESLARAALQALREPDEPALDAGALVGPDTNSGEFGYGDAHAVFTAMIDAILEEKPE